MLDENLGTGKNAPTAAAQTSSAKTARPGGHVNVSGSASRWGKLKTAADNLVVKPFQEVGPLGLGCMAVT